MRPIKTSESNFVFKGDGRDVIDLHCRVGHVEAPVYQDGAPVTASVWAPTEEERERIAAGENIRLSVLFCGPDGMALPPSWLEVVPLEEVE